MKNQSTKAGIMKKLSPIIILLFCSYAWSINDEFTDREYDTLIWSDEFEYTGLPDTTKWDFDLGNGCPDICGWGNDELQYYTDESRNVRVENGLLVIELHKENTKDSLITSGRLVSNIKEAWKYGRFEIRAKLPSALGTWSAIWMLPTEWKYGDWPRSGEIDIMENVGYDPDTIIASAHTGAYNHMIETHKNSSLLITDSDEVFHTYILEWEEEEYRVYVDETLFFTFNNEHLSSEEWPFDQKFHLILNLAFGGNWGGKMGIDLDALPAKMEVDYVRVYQ